MIVRLATVATGVAAMALAAGATPAQAALPAEPTSVVPAISYLGFVANGTYDTCTGVIDMTAAASGYDVDVDGLYRAGQLEVVYDYAGPVFDGSGTFDPYVETFRAATTQTLIELNSVGATGTTTRVGTPVVEGGVPTVIEERAGTFYLQTFGEQGCSKASTIANNLLKSASTADLAAAKSAWGGAKNWQGKYISATSAEYPNGFVDSYLAGVTEAVTAALTSGSY